jgi:hypothetical protein
MRPKPQKSKLLELGIVLHVTWNSDFIDVDYLRDYCRPYTKPRFCYCSRFRNYFQLAFMFLTAFMPPK